MSSTKSQVRPGAYFDSVVLMQLQRNLLTLPGVEDAGVVMATPANLELLADSDLLSNEGKSAKPEDLLIVVRAAKAADAEAALGKVDELLKQRRSSAGSSFRPRSLSAAVKNLPAAEWVLVSVPGRYAAKVAHEALDLGKHVFLYSDNVSLQDEIALKQKAVKKNLLVMGPDCGTAIINGIGLGFANRVRRGSIGLVAASGTGLQTVTTKISNLKGGVSQAIGTGSRDLKSQVGALSMLQGLHYLAADSETKVIVLISKPPDAEVATRLLAAAHQCSKPVVVDFIGFAPPAAQIGNLYFAAGLDQAARLAVDLAKQPASKKAETNHLKGYLRGLFSGGTLAYEVLNGLQLFLSPIYSNIPIRSEQKLETTLNSKAHTILDLGEDEFTVGRLHPMMDNDLRLRRMKQEAEDNEVGMILLDVVLGEGAHPNPAGELAPAIVAHRKLRKEREFVALVIGTTEDPQQIDEQIRLLIDAAAIVFRDVSATVNYIAARLSQPIAAAETLAKFSEPLAAINMGVESFYDSLKAQGAQAVQVDWRPPASGNEDLARILEKMKA
ncbi:MAG: acyl-CoA synthetase FdrA [Chloroflexi bacterium]|nr:acyl-CoA synthetase FdrA [Chloroflexota bacterium]